MTRLLLWIGTIVLSLCREIGGMALLLAYTVAMLLRGKFDGRELLRNLYKMGVVSVPIVALTALFTGGTMVIQSGIFVQRFQAYGLLGWGTGYAVLREVGPILIGLMFSGRVGANNAADLGSMVVTEQVDALRMCAADPIEYLVVPRFKGGIIATTAVIIWSAMIAWTSGMLTAWSFFGVLPRTFANTSMVGVGDLVIGLTKCVAYGAAIPVVSGWCGLTATGGSEGVGWATTRAVVNSSLAVIALNFVISGVGFLIFPT